MVKHECLLTDCLALTLAIWEVDCPSQGVFLFGWFFLQFSSCALSCSQAPLLSIYTWGTAATSVLSLGSDFIQLVTVDCKPKVVKNFDETRSITLSFLMLHLLWLLFGSLAV